MTARLATALIFLFCGTMTVLLVRSVLYPEESGLADVAPQVPFDLFVARGEGSHLDIWDGNRITGNCAIVPETGITGPKDRNDKVKVRLEVRLQLRKTILGSSLIDVSGTTMVHANGELSGHDLRIELDGSDPLIKLTIKQTAKQPSPDLKLMRGSAVLFEITTGTPLQGTNGLLAAGMLQALGVSPEALSGKQENPEIPSTVRAGHIEAGGQLFDGYLFTSGAEEESKFRLYMSNTGEIVRIKTPLGMEMLAESLRPKDVEAPTLGRYKSITGKP